MDNSMGSFTFRVTPEEVQKQAIRLLQHEKNVRNKFDSLINRLIRSQVYWEGCAATNFREQCISYQKEIEEILNRLLEHGNNLEQISATYTGVERIAEQASADLPIDIIL